ncbi:MAG: hypothetical protein ABSA53_26765, partial [Streptosporangiaceae bacterium]
LTTLVVVVTANHFWLDGIVAGLLVALVLAGQRLGSALADAHRRASASALGLLTRQRDAALRATAASLVRPGAGHDGDDEGQFGRSRVER